MALQLGITYAATPEVGIAGQLQVGEFSGSAAVRFDSDEPAKSMVAVAFESLYLHDIIRAFCSPEVIEAVPVELIGDMGLEAVNVYIVPQDTRIGELLSACEQDDQLIGDPTSPAAVNGARPV